jgi:hypothetical protein
MFRDFLECESMIKTRLLTFGILLFVVALLLGGRLLFVQNREDESHNKDRNERTPPLPRGKNASPVSPLMSGSKSTSSRGPLRENTPPDLNVEAIFSREKADKDIEIELHLLEREKVDPELFSKWDMAESERGKASTQALLSHFIGSPMPVMFGAYDDVNLGIERALRSCKTLKAFVERADIAAAVELFYDSFPYFPEDMPEKAKQQLTIVRSNMSHSDYSGYVADRRNEADLIVGARSMQLYRTDQLMLFPLVFDHLKGHEKPLLLALVRRFRKVEKVRAKYGSDAYAAASGAAYSLSVTLVKNVAPSLADQFKDTHFGSETWEADHYAKLDTFLRSMPAP